MELNSWYLYRTLTAGNIKVVLCSGVNEGSMFCKNKNGTVKLCPNQTLSASAFRVRLIPTKLSKWSKEDENA